jgi:glucarate dehydratase
MSGHATIREVRATPVNIPIEAPYHCSVGVFAGFSKTVVEVESTDGVVGIGEAPNPFAARVIETRIAPKLMGADPYDLAECERRAVPPIETYKNTDDNAIVLAYGGVEMALWDLVGKLEGRSVAALLGGQVRGSIPFTEYFAFRLSIGGVGGESTPKEVASYCARMAEEHGAVRFEGKAGVLSIGTEVEMLREIRAAVGDDALVRLDANMAWSTTVAREALRRFEPYNVGSFEEPVRTLHELSRLRSSTSISFSSHEPDLTAAVRLGVPDAFVINLTQLGGIRRTVKFIGACEAFGIDVWFYSEPGISTAAQLQVASALEWLSQPSQTLARWQPDDVIVGGPFRPEAGSLPVPRSPGIGVDLDRVALKRAHARFRDEGPYDQYADPAARPGGFVH